jgi:DNA-binding response OmpR family regulator
MSVVLVEDDESVRESLLALMQFWGVQAQALGHTADIEAWLRQADAPGPDVLISDYRLGQLNGIDVVMRARERFQRPLPALIITGDTSVQDLRKLESSGLPVLHKPFRSEHLLQQLQALAASLDKA